MRTKFLLTLAMLLAACMPAAARAESDAGAASFYPWSGYWWPHSDGGMNKPLKKYDQFTGARAAEWEAQNHNLAADAPSWHGYCHAWSAASVTEKEPKAGRTVTGAAEVSFGVGDQKALLCGLHTDDIAHTWGQRYSGASSDKNDIKPDELWALLQSHVKQQKIPLVLDLEAGAEVWNYPVYQYRIDYHDAGNGWSNGTMQLVAADDDVQPDYVGTDASLYTYTFRVRFQNGAMVMGSGEWTGESVEDHPDFAWYPYVAVAGNPELEVAQVSKIVGFNAGGNGAPIDGGGDEPVDVDPPTDETGNPVAINPEPIDSMISPGELAELVINQTSSFRIDANILGPNGGGDGLKFNPGDKYRIEVVSEEKGYLYLFHITPDGDLKLIFPQAGEPNLIDGGKDKRYVLPVGKDSWLTAEGTGRHDIKAIVTEKPLRLTGFTFAMQQQQQQQSGGGETPKQEPQVQQKASQPIYVYPAAHKRLRGRLFGFFRKGGEQEQEAKPPTKLGRFAQDVASFQVLPAGGAPAQQDGAQTGQSEPKPAPRQNPLPKPNR